MFTGSRRLPREGEARSLQLTTSTASRTACLRKQRRLVPRERYTLEGKLLTRNAPRESGRT